MITRKQTDLAFEAFKQNAQNLLGAIDVYKKDLEKGPTLAASTSADFFALLDAYESYKTTERQLEPLLGTKKNLVS